MKKNKLMKMVLAIVCIAALALGLVACGGEPAASEVTLESIAISQEPNKIVYEVGETFDPSGMEITATYSDGSTKVIKTGYSLSHTTATKLTGEETEITVTYQEKTATQPISFKLVTATFKGFWVGGGDVPNTATFYNDGTVVVTPLIYAQTYNWHLDTASGLVVIDYTPNENFQDAECRVVGNMVEFYCFSRVGLSHYLPIDEYNSIFGTNLTTKEYTAEDVLISLSAGADDELVLYKNGLCSYNVDGKAYTALWNGFNALEMNAFGMGGVDHTFAGEKGEEKVTVTVTAGGAAKTYEIALADWDKVLGGDRPLASLEAVAAVPGTTVELYYTSLEESGRKLVLTVPGAPMAMETTWNFDETTKTLTIADAQAGPNTMTFAATIDEATDTLTIEIASPQGNMTFAMKFSSFYNGYRTQTQMLGHQ
mgnify:CR=1 FL=1